MTALRPKANHALPAPCIPADPNVECASCQRHTHPIPTWRSAKFVVIDASTVKRAGEPCRMHA